MLVVMCAYVIETAKLLSAVSYQNRQATFPSIIVKMKQMGRESQSLKQQH